MFRTFILLLLLAILPSSAGFGQDQPRKRERVAPRVERERKVIIRSGGSYLGVNLKDVDAETMKRLRLAEEAGALVVGIAEKSPAAEAGLLEDDVIVAWNGTRVESVRQLQRFVSETPVGRKVAIDLIRGGHRTSVSATLTQQDRWPFAGADADILTIDTALAGRLHILGGRLDSLGRALSDSIRIYLSDSIPMDFQMDGPGAAQFFIGGGSGRMGVELQPVGDQLAKYFGVEKGTGALIANVRESSAAATAGLLAGDVIVEIGAEPVRGPGDVGRIIRGRDEGPVDVKVIRDRREQVFTVRLGARSEGPRGGLFEFGLPDTWFDRLDGAPDDFLRWFDLESLPELRQLPRGRSTPHSDTDVELVSN